MNTLPLLLITKTLCVKLFSPELSYHTSIDTKYLAIQSRVDKLVVTFTLESKNINASSNFTYSNEITALVEYVFKERPAMEMKKYFANLIAEKAKLKCFVLQRIY